MKKHKRLVKIDKLKVRWHKCLDILFKLQQELNSVRDNKRKAELNKLYSHFKQYSGELDKEINKLEELYKKEIK